VTHLDDFPKHDEKRELEEKSKSRFREAISGSDQFLVQSEDDSDYGVDFWIEARDGQQMKNVRVAVQLKGTRSESNTDGSVSRSVKRTTLNYLAMNPASVFVCYHAPTDGLLVRRVDDVLDEYENCPGWGDQSTITVRFKEAFTPDFQKKLNEYAVTSAKGARDRRLLYATSPPERLGDLSEGRGVDLPVPADAAKAEALLEELYSRGQDRSISDNFEKFRAVLGPSDGRLVRAYMAEVNLGINGPAFDRDRIAHGIGVLQDAVTGGVFSPGSLLYSVGNGYLALGDYRKAADTYEAALEALEESDGGHLAARCCKNLGTAKGRLGDVEGAHVLYLRSLELDGDLAEAHFALALSYMRGPEELGGLELALEHLDAIMYLGESAITPTSVQGWRAEILFKLGRTAEAFRDVQALQGRAREAQWVLPWCARLVATYGRPSAEAARRSLRFWGACAEEFRGTFALEAERERLLCAFRIQMNGEQTPYRYEEVKRNVERLVEQGVVDPAFLWDRCGHWAQDDGDWVEAEDCYRRAVDLSPDEYGYCLGTALNFLGRYEEALPILLPQAKQHQPDALSWFQVAVASEGTGDVEGAVDAYRRALKLDEAYDRAWFNLGGVYWNSGRVTEAEATWKEAVRRFPAHEFAAEIEKNVPGLLTDSYTQGLARLSKGCASPGTSRNRSRRS